MNIDALVGEIPHGILANERRDQLSEAVKLNQYADKAHKEDGAEEPKHQVPFTLALVAEACLVQRHLYILPFPLHPPCTLDCRLQCHGAGDMC